MAVLIILESSEHGAYKESELLLLYSNWENLQPQANLAFSFSIFL